MDSIMRNRAWYLVALSVAFWFVDAAVAFAGEELQSPEAQNLKKELDNVSKDYRKGLKEFQLRELTNRLNFIFEKTRKAFKDKAISTTEYAALLNQKSQVLKRIQGKSGEKKKEPRKRNNLIARPVKLTKGKWYDILGFGKFIEHGKVKEVGTSGSVLIESNKTRVATSVAIPEGDAEYSVRLMFIQPTENGAIALTLPVGSSAVTIILNDKDYRFGLSKIKGSRLGSTKNKTGSKLLINSEIPYTLDVYVIAFGEKAYIWIQIIRSGERVAQATWRGNVKDLSSDDNYKFSTSPRVIGIGVDRKGTYIRGIKISVEQGKVEHLRSPKKRKQ